jgi:hypothetical protein
MNRKQGHTLLAEKSKDEISNFTPTEDKMEVDSKV